MGNPAPERRDADRNELVKIDGIRYGWKPGDIICVPMFAWHRHINESNVLTLYVASTTGPLPMWRGQAVHEDQRHPQYFVFAQQVEEAGIPGFGPMPGSDCLLRGERQPRSSSGSMPRLGARLRARRRAISSAKRASSRSTCRPTGCANLSATTSSNGAAWSRISTSRRSDRLDEMKQIPSHSDRWPANRPSRSSVIDDNLHCTQVEQIS